MEKIPEPRIDPPEPKVICECVTCGRGIYEGELAHPVDGWGWECEECSRVLKEVWNA